MRGFRRFAVTVMAATGGVTIVLLITGWGAAAAGDIKEVIIGNSPSQAVPVREQGTPAVTVANQSLNVHDTGTVNVAVGGPIATTQAGTPVTIHFASAIDTFQSYDVPTGKRLVIEYVYGWGTGGANIEIGDNPAIFSFHGSNQVLLFVDGGQSVTYTGPVDTQPSPPTGGATISGYLIDG